jgi:L-alanine-DL-glutamate epimerase-like enolase superfamily enzyme
VNPTPHPQARIERVDLSVFQVPTDSPESDGTYEWNGTTLVLVEVHAANKTGLGYSYASRCTPQLIKEHLTECILRQDALDIPGHWQRMVHAIRNLGRPGICSMAIAAVDFALWDLKGRLLELPLVRLLGAGRDGIAVYGSGGFTSYSIAELQTQLSGWVEKGIPRVKMKIGRQPQKDLERVRAAREAIGADAELFVDANGAYSRKQALKFADAFGQLGVVWFEEPVSSDDVTGLRLLRDHLPAGMEVAAGEYGYDLPYFLRMLQSGAVDVLQADATRCAGITGFMQAGTLCDAFSTPFSAHTAPALHLHPCCAVPRARHLEYFHDHVRIEQMLFDGVMQPVNGILRPNLQRPGLVLELKRSEAQRYAASG